MYGQLGDVVFQRLIGFDTLNRATRPKYAEHPLLTGKARLQRVGDELDLFTFDISLDRSFSNPDEMLDQLKAYIEAGEVVSFSNGAGTNFGKYVITSLSENVRQLTIDGQIQTVTLSVEIKEFFDPNPVSTSLVSQRANAFALSQNNPVLVQALGKIPTPMGEVSSLTGSAIAGGVSANELVQRVIPLPSQQENLFLQAFVKLNQVREDCQVVIDKLQSVQSLAAKAPQLLDAMIQYQANAELLKTSVSNGDLTNALINSETLLSSSDSVSSAVLPLDVILITRKEQ